MDFCASLFFIAIGIVFLAVIGHGLWLVLTAILRAMGTVPPEASASHPASHIGSPPSDRPRTCVACGTTSIHAACPECGLIANSPTSNRLRDLEITAKEIQRLIDEERLEAGIGEKVYHALEESQKLLLGDHAPIQRKGTSPAWVRLDDLLGEVTNVADLSLDQRRLALKWYRQIEEADLGRLSPHGLLLLSRLLDIGGLGSRALHIVHLLTDRHPTTRQGARGLVEGARLAVRLEKFDQARSLLRRATQHQLTEDENEELERLWSVVGGAVATSKVVEVAASPPVIREADLVRPPLAQPVSIPESSTPVEPRPTWGQWLGAFMEEKNILWGELVGGLLIVGCSIALVISLWQTLEQIPYFPFLIFSLITTAIFGAGFYTLGHWKLESTSRGLLVIGALLTPLNFLVLAGLSRGREAGLLDILAEVGSLAFFSFLIWRSAHVLLREALGKRWGEASLTLAVIGTTASQLLVPRWLSLAEPVLALFILLSLVPVICHAMALGMAWLHLSRREALTLQASHGLLLLLGLSTFSLCVALGFLAYWSTDPLATLSQLAVPIALGAMPLIPCAGLLYDRVTDSTAGDNDPAIIGMSPAIVRVTGTVIGLSAMAIMLGTLGLAWPRPLGIGLIGFLNFLVFTLFALRYRVPHAHLPAIVCLALSSLTAWHAAAGAFAFAPTSSELLRLFASTQSGIVLALLAVLVAAASEAAYRLGRPLDALHQGIGAGVLAALSVLFIHNHPETTAERAFVLGLFGAGMLTINLRWREKWLTLVGSSLLLGFAYWLAKAGMPELAEEKKWLLISLGQGLIWVAAAMGIWRASGMGERIGLSAGDDNAKEADSHAGNVRHGAWDAFGETFEQSGMALAIGSLIPLIATMRWDFLVENALCWTWLGLIWLTLAWGRREAGYMAPFQIATLIAVLVGTTAWLAGQPWVERARDLYDHWSSLQTYALALALYALTWTIFRRFVPSDSPLNQLVNPPWPTFDRLALGVVVLWQVAMAVIVLIPAVGRELYPPELLGRWQRVDDLLFQLDVAWLLLGISAVALLVAMRERFGIVAFLGLVILALEIPVLLAMGLREQRAAASGLRWGMAAAFLVGSILLWMRERLHRWREARLPSWQLNFDLAPVLRPLLLCCAATPVFLITAIVAIEGFSGRTPPGPLPGSFFRTLGWIPSMLIPLGVLSFTLAGHGVREESSGYFFSAGQVALLTVVGGYALGQILRGAPFGRAEFVTLLQLGVVTTSSWALVWLFAWRRGDDSHLHLQVLMGPLALCILLIVVALEFVTSPGGPHSVHLHQTGSVLGWTSLVLVLISGLYHLRHVAPKAIVDGVGFGGLAMGVMLACTVSAWFGPGWQGYHLLTLFWTLLGITLLTFGWAGASLQAIGPGFWSKERRAQAALALGRCFPAWHTRRWVEAIAVLVVLLALRGAWNDPARPYWSALSVLAVAVLLGAMAVWTRRQAYVYLSGLGVNLLAYLLWHAWLTDVIGIQVWVGLGPGFFDRFLSVQILALAVAAGIWAVIEMGLRRREPSIELRGQVFPFVHAATILALQLLGLLTAISLAGDVLTFPVRQEGILIWLALAMIAAVLILCLWDPQARRASLPECGLFCLGVIGIGLGLHQTETMGRDLLTWATVLLAAYVAFTSFLMRWLRSPFLDAEENWLHYCQTPLAVYVLVSSFWMCLDLDTPGERLLGPLALGLLIGATLLNSITLREVTPRRWVLASLLVLLPLQAAWALLDPTIAAPWLHRLVLLLAVLTIMAGIYVSRVFGRAARETPWGSVLVRFGGGLFALAGLNLGIVLVCEFLLYDPVRRTTPLAWPGMVLVGVLLAGVLVFALWLALSRRNPLDLAHRGQRNLVYAAEGMLLLLLTHFRLSAPDLFPSFMGRNWHFVLMALGFVGVGLGELFRRRSVPALAEPLHGTGLFLPLLPLLAFLVRPIADFSGLEQAIPGLQPIVRYLRVLPHEYTIHALLWFLLALLYVSIALFRRTSGWALLAALAANFGLWVIYANHADFRFLLHPQLWLIPLGLIILCAEHLHREQLSPAPANAMRYVGLLVIYVSSSADLFIAGLGNSVWLPIVLAVFSILGVLAGILLRVRAFLFLGIAFLFLVVFAQIWHAAVNRGQTWIWWASGIVLGALILTMFALFEKRRNEILKLLDDLKRWD